MVYIASSADSAGTSWPNTSTNVVTVGGTTTRRVKSATFGGFRLDGLSRVEPCRCPHPLHFLVVIAHHQPPFNRLMPTHRLDIPGQVAPFFPRLPLTPSNARGDRYRGRENSYTPCTATGVGSGRGPPARSRVSSAEGFAGMQQLRPLGACV